MASYYSCDVSKEPEYKVLEMATTYKFPLDPFQTHAIAAIDQEHNVLVCAKTGSGKTLVGEYQIAHSLKKGKRVFYTTPIKSLSNQKFHDLKQLYPGIGKVGIMTGDIKFCPDAEIVIMTTEILRNLLYKQGTKTQALGLTASLSLQGLGAVIFDECHYINDKDRGKIWEETMILLPEDVQLVLLSATLDSPEHFAQWLSELKGRSCALIETQYRVVPLIHSVLCGGQPQTLMDAKEMFNPAVYRDWIQWRNKKVKDHETYQKQVVVAKAGGHEGKVEGKVTATNFIHQLNECVSMLEEKGLLPGLVFVFSRAATEKYADKITSQLLDSSDSALAERIFDFHLRHHKQNLETLPQYHHLRRQVIRGIAFHHSGVLPVLKEVIEILFSKGLIKLLFATETFAVGINMPTKTVLFLNYYKYDSEKQGLRILRTDEYIQMAGRAGRRGKDDIGHVFYLPEREPPTLDEVQRMMKGGKPRVESRMEFGYDFLLKTLHSKNLKWRGLMEKSYWFKQWEQNQDSIKKEIEGLTKKMAAIYLTDAQKQEIIVKLEIEELVKELQNAKKRDAQRSLDKWKDTHLGPQWFNAEKNYKEWNSLSKEKKSLENMIGYNSDSIERRLDFLVQSGFLNKDKETLTLRGQAATEFNEGQPILCTELAFLGTMNNLDVKEFVTCLACFITESDKGDANTLESLEVDDSIKTTLKAIGSINNEFYENEYSVTKVDSNFWDLSLTWIESVWQWLNGGNMSQICSTYGLFEGNFVRVILRLASLVEEWTSVATLLEDVKLLEKLEGVRALLVKDAVVPDSLYLHL